MELSDRLPGFAPLETDRTPTGNPNFSIEELQLACRNRGMPLEALRYDVTPTGLHYLLSHFDIPAVRPDRFRLELCGLVGRELTLGLCDLMARPSATRRVTMECAGNDRHGRVDRDATSRPARGGRRAGRRRRGGVHRPGRRHGGG
jgi:Oxidoreductase molybdopterin binding domain